MKPLKNLFNPVYCLIMLLIAQSELMGKAELEPLNLSIEILNSIDRGTDFLSQMQNEDGSWGSARRTKGLNIMSPVPSGHHALKGAVSAISLSALIELEALGYPGVEQVVEDGELWMLKNLPELKRSSPYVLYNVWTHIYGIQALLNMKRKHGRTRAELLRINELITQQIDFLEKYESIGGGWGYLDVKLKSRRTTSATTPFMTASVLIVLKDALNEGFHINKKVISRALKHIKRMQKPDKSYMYNEDHRMYPTALSNLQGGSLGRSQACNLALYAYDDDSIDQNVMNEWVGKFFNRHGWLDMGRKKPIPHESFFSVAGYYYYYGHYYTGLTLAQFPNQKARPYAQKMGELLIHRQEKDGSWWDYPLYDYHKYYGTGFALMSLVRCMRILDSRPLIWTRRPLHK